MLEAPFSSACANLPPAALLQIQGQNNLIPPLFGWVS